MPLSRELLEQMKQLCSEIDPEDGVVPPRDHRPPDPRRLRRHCGQVARLLSVTLPAAEDPLLRLLFVVQVTADPTGNLRVRLAPLPGVDVPPEVLLAHVSRARGWLRGEVATFVGGKRTPELLFEIGQPDEEEAP
jgi:hypothetical protein